VTVADHGEPTKPGAHGTGMARRQVTLNALPPGDRRSTADQLPERGLVADRIEVGVGAGERA
jgi:hypothetical protein